MKTDKAKRNNLPSKSKIAAYWDLRIDDFGVYVPMQEHLEPDNCWACGRIGQIQRCHIVDYADGGSNTEDNLVLLCAGCHAESEGFSPPAFWNWIRHTREHGWVDGMSRIVRKIKAAGYSQEKIGQMIAEHGYENAMHLIGADMYGRQFISKKDTVQ